EPGAVGVPVVAAPVAEMRRALAAPPGAHGRVATTAEEWRAHVHELLDEEQSRAEGQAAREEVLRAHSSRAVAGALAGALAELTSGRVKTGTPRPRRPKWTTDWLHTARDVTRVARAV